jgi:hypothetical protein
VKLPAGVQHRLFPDRVLFKSAGSPAVAGGEADCCIGYRKAGPNLRAGGAKALSQRRLFPGFFFQLCFLST